MIERQFFPVKSWESAPKRNLELERIRTERIMERKLTNHLTDSPNFEADDVISPVQEFLQDQNHCCLCGTEFKFTHKMDHLTLTVVEDAKCESCHVSLRTRTHTLQ